jgi:hypothetical protein
VRECRSVRTSVAAMVVDLLVAGLRSGARLGLSGRGGRGAQVDRLVDLVLGRLGADTAVRLLVREVETAVPTARTLMRVRLAVEEAIEQDVGFAAGLGDVVARVTPVGVEQAGVVERAVQARVARRLGELALPRQAGPMLVPPPVYVRRHVAEHAAAGDALMEVMTAAVLPYVDAGRLRARLRSGAAVGPVLTAWRRVAYLWDWDRPHVNAVVFDLALSAAGVAMPRRPPGRLWSAMWASWMPSISEIVGRHANAVTAVAVGQLVL